MMNPPMENAKQTMTSIKASGWLVVLDSKIVLMNTVEIFESINQWRMPQENNGFKTVEAAKMGSDNLI